MSVIKDHKLFEDFFDELDQYDDIDIDNMQSDADMFSDSASEEDAKILKVQIISIDVQFRDSMKKIDEFINKLKLISDDIKYMLSNVPFVNNVNKIEFELPFWKARAKESFERDGIYIYNDPKVLTDAELFKNAANKIYVYIDADINIQKHSQILDFLKLFCIYIQRRFQHRFNKKAKFWALDYMDKDKKYVYSTSVKRVKDIFSLNNNKQTFEHLKKIQRMLMNNRDYTFIDNFLNREKGENELDAECFRIMKILNIPDKALAYKDGNVLFIEIGPDQKWDCKWSWKQANQGNISNKYKVYITVNGELIIDFYGAVARNQKEYREQKFFNMIAPNINKLRIFTTLNKNTYYVEYTYPEMYTIDLSRFFINELIIRDSEGYSYSSRNNYVKPIFKFYQKPKKITYYHKSTDSNSYKKVDKL